MTPTQTVTRPKRLTVRNVMTESVITAGESATFPEMARLLAQHPGGALPILDVDGVMVGIVSGTDLLPKEALPPAPHLWPQRSLTAETVKAEAITAGDVMSSPIVSAYPGEPLSVAVRRMLDHNVSQLPVLEKDGRLVGILSRQDALRAFERGDEEIRLDIVDGVLPRWMGIKPDTIEVSVAGGIVLLRGGLERRSEATTLGHLAASLDGVVAVDNELCWTDDDSRVQRS